MQIYFYCFSDINECLPDPCKNEGTCKDLINGYECTCAAGYDGIDCDNSNIVYILLIILNICLCRS
jgi:hypothetical protein